MQGHNYLIYWVRAVSALVCAIIVGVQVYKPANRATPLVVRMQNVFEGLRAHDNGLVLQVHMTSPRLLDAANA